MSAAPRSCAARVGSVVASVGPEHAGDAGITGQIENCQTVVFGAYVTARAHTLFNFRL